MRQLYWKEWREQRWLPLVMTALTLVLNGIWASLVYHTHMNSAMQASLYSPPNTGPHENSNTEVLVNLLTFMTGGSGILAPKHYVPLIVGGSGSILFIVWLLAGALAGAGGTDADAGSETRKFLFALPVKRRTLWFIKVSTALGILIASLLLSGLCCYVMDALLYGPRFIDVARAAGLHVGFRAAVEPALQTALLAFAAALAASPAIERVTKLIVAMGFAGPAVSVSVPALTDWALARLVPLGLVTASYSYALVANAQSLLLFLVASVFIGVSYITFTHGGSQEPTRATRLHRKAIGGAFVVAAVVFVAVVPLLTDLR